MADRDTSGNSSNKSVDDKKPEVAKESNNLLPMKGENLIQATEALELTDSERRLDLSDQNVESLPYEILTQNNELLRLFDKPSMHLQKQRWLRHKEKLDKIKSYIHYTGQLKASKTQQEREQMEQQSKLELPYPIQGSSRTEIIKNLDRMSIITEKIRNAHTMHTQLIPDKFYEFIADLCDEILICLEEICTILDNETGLKGHNKMHIGAATMVQRSFLTLKFPNQSMLSILTLQDVEDYLHNNTLLIRGYMKGLKRILKLDE